MQMRVDPESRCAAVLLFGRRIAILPFRREVSRGGILLILGVGSVNVKKKVVFTNSDFFLSSLVYRILFGGPGISLYLVQAG